MTIGGWGAVTDRGRLRAANEDALLADPPLFIVADGMGGHAAGDVASWTAIEAFVDLVGEEPISVDDAVRAVEDANAAILRIALSTPEKAGMGTTLSGLARITAGGADHWLVFNVGDSRVYRLADGHLEQLTVDHSEVEEMILAGQLTREQARSHRRRNVVTRSLGTDPAPLADSWVFPPIAGERFLICSDGLNTELTDEAMRTALESQPDPQLAARALVDLALEAGGRDNITAIVVDGPPSVASDGVDDDTVPRDGHAG